VDEKLHNDEVSKGTDLLHEGATADPLDTAPGDVAALYSRNNLEGGKYRDFSASRDLARARTVRRKDGSRFKPERLTPVKEQTARSETQQFPSGAKKQPFALETSRWAALKNVLGHTAPDRKKIDLPEVPIEVPALALLSFAGGVGKTSIAASLARLMVAQNESTLLVDTQPYRLLSQLFDRSASGAKVPETGLDGRKDAPVVLLQAGDMAADFGERGQQLAEQIAQEASELDRVVIDVATASVVVLRQILRLSPTLLVVLTPDMASVISLEATNDFFEDWSRCSGLHLQPYYVLNHFDANLRLHLDIREALSMRLGDRLLPFALRRSPSVGEALAEGMTVEAYAPGSEIAEDLKRLARWILDQHAGTVTELPNNRWGDR
jgi:cellulose synthase operon protein YhjQ